MSLYFYLHNHINWSGGRQTGWTEGEFGYKMKAVVVENGREEVKLFFFIHGFQLFIHILSDISASTEEL